MSVGNFDLKIAGIEISLHAAHTPTIQQSYQPFGGVTLKERHNGDTVVQKHFSKFETTINAQGWMPEGLDGADLHAPFEIYCYEPLSIQSFSNAIAIARTYRTDAGYTPSGVALVNGEPVVSTVVIAGGVATIAAVSGASQYLLHYFPVLTCVSERGVERNGGFSWSLTAREVAA